MAALAAISAPANIRTATSVNIATSPLGGPRILRINHWAIQMFRVLWMIAVCSVDVPAVKRKTEHSENTAVMDR
jgi:hypothetical protein